MASLLKLKVSEETYRDTLQKLGEKLQMLTENLERIKNHRQSIESKYTGPQADEAIKTLKTDEEQLQKSIDAVQKQRDTIEKYLDSMITTDSNIKSSYQDAMKLASDVFN